MIYVIQSMDNEFKFVIVTKMNDSDTQRPYGQRDPMAKRLTVHSVKSTQYLKHHCYLLAPRE